MVTWIKQYRVMVRDLSCGPGWEAVQGCSCFGLGSLDVGRAKLIQESGDKPEPVRTGWDGLFQHIPNVNVTPELQVFCHGPEIKCHTLASLIDFSKPFHGGKGILSHNFKILQQK